MRVYSFKGEEMRRNLDRASSKKGSKSKGAVPFDDYKLNPLYLKYKFSIGVYIFSSFVMFVFLPLYGNRKLNGRLLCTSADVWGPGIGRSVCNYMSGNVYIWVFFLLNTVYFLLSALQIRDGESFLKNQRKSDRRWTNG